MRINQPFDNRPSSIDNPRPLVAADVRRPIAYRELHMLALRTEEDAVILPVKVVPGASRTRILGLWEGRLRIAIAAAPEKGQANAALCAFLAKQLQLRKRDVDVIAGHTSPLKDIRITGIAESAVRTTLEPASPD